MISAMLHASSVNASSVGIAPGPGSARNPNGILRVSQRTKSENAVKNAPATWSIVNDRTPWTSDSPRAGQPRYGCGMRRMAEAILWQSLSHHFLNSGASM